MAANLVRTVARNGTGLLAAVLAVLLAITLLQTGAEAKHEDGHVPANKVGVAASSIEVLEADTPDVILSTWVKVPSSKAIVLAVTLECSLVTDVRTIGTEDESDSHAEATVDIWVEVDGQRVTVSDTFESNGPETEVTFCNRQYRRTIRDWDEDDEERLETFIETKSANAFNWIELNNETKPVLVEVWAQVSSNIGGNNPIAEENEATGMVGNRTLTVTPIDVAHSETKTEHDTHDHGGGAAGGRSRGGARPLRVQRLRGLSRLLRGRQQRRGRSEPRRVARGQGRRLRAHGDRGPERRRRRGLPARRHAVVRAALGRPGERPGRVPPAGLGRRSSSAGTGSILSPGG
jgi:hypothetical protein